jgi:hypothetical protein
MMRFKFEDEYTENYLDFETLSDTDISGLLDKLITEQIERKKKYLRDLVFDFSNKWLTLNENGIAVCSEGVEIKWEDITFSGIERD